jgi:aspartate--ammonia ligase
VGRNGPVAPRVPRRSGAIWATGPNVIGDILVWNPVTQRRHELMSGGIRVNAESLRQQFTMSRPEDFLHYPYHQAILHDPLPQGIGGGIGQSRTQMLLLRKAHPGEASISVWPRILAEISEKNNMHVLD